MLIEIGKKQMEKDDIEIQERVDRAVNIAQRALKEVQRQCKIYKARGEKEPHFLEQMACAYINAITHYQAFKLLEEEGMTLQNVKDNCAHLLGIAFGHLENKYDPVTEEIKQ